MDSEAKQCARHARGNIALAGDSFGLVFGSALLASCASGLAVVRLGLDSSCSGFYAFLPRLFTNPAPGETLI